MAAAFPTLLDEYVRFLNESIATLEAQNNSTKRENISRQIGPGHSAMVEQLKKTRLNELMSGKNVDTTVPPHVENLQDRLIDLLSENRQMTSIDDVFISLEDDINRISSRTGNNLNAFNRWAESHPDHYDSLLLSYLRSIGNQGGGRRRNKRRSRRHRKKSKNTRRH